MPIARVNGTDLFYTEVGRGVPILVEKDEEPFDK